MNRLYRVLLAALLLMVLQFATAGEQAGDKGCVILLHGLARTGSSMSRLAEAAETAGYRVANIDYPSRQYPIEELAPRSVEQGVEQCRARGDGPIHFITHSMGGILVRYYLRYFELPAIGRVVMLSPPNRGSEVADELADWKLYQWINGPAGQQLVTDPDGLIARLGPVDFPLGIITGNRHAFYDDWLADLIPGDNDGKVAVARASISGMRDFLVMPYSHSFIMQEPEAIRQALYFLAHGRFDRAPGERSE
jgi:pimeloyl-ACP methyl ester carboxylesterase